ncbi:hypothetical protein [Helicobacter trogontum]|uniref:Uncharacterized protein n=1 Tax=Helicobacter trogontum TaxID=50960 RepID=A0A4U8TFR0_9HELI|nr:hypothetical protein [Helicobacter trogontum]MCI5785952.1 hypothetical protein [Helicobacter trogontum]MDY5185307.1 hypothetical protein [Helicobacter trogontum]TLD98951.1 hypothetical protein LS80_002845 [Helicobacter trogontum]
MQRLQPSIAEDDVKIHLACKNIFLSLSLGFYLKGHLSAIDKADFIITDSVLTKEKFTHIPICVIGSDLRIPCSVYEMFFQLHEFYSHVNAKQAQIFQKDMHTLQQNELKHNKTTHQTKKNHARQSKPISSNQANVDMIEAIKQQKMQEVIQQTNPALSGQIELLFNELSQKIYDTLKNNSPKD